MTPEQIQLFINAAGSPAAIALGSSPVVIKVFGCIHEYIGLWWGPHQTLREAKAQARADATTQLIKQSLDPNASEDERLLAQGLLANEKKILREQKNNQSIVRKALPEVQDDAKPDEVEDDWYANFFDKSRLVSDEEMQILWGKVLAGEINHPGTFSRRLLHLLSILDKKAAEDFLLLCRFTSTLEQKPYLPIIYDRESLFFQNASFTFDVIKKLSSMGVISDNAQGFTLIGEVDRKIHLEYFTTIFLIDFPDTWKGDFKIGEVAFTDLGIANPME